MLTSSSIGLRTSIIDNADGSAELSIYNNNDSNNSNSTSSSSTTTTDDNSIIKLITSINGPIEPKQRQELPNRASLEINIYPSIGLSTTKEKLLENKLRSILQNNIIINYKYPRQLIQISIQFLISNNNSNGGSNSSNGMMTNLFDLNALINCCYFALIDANIAMNYSFVSIIIIIDHQGNLIIPFEKNEYEYEYEYKFKYDLQDYDSIHLCCYSIIQNKVDKLLLLESQGNFNESQLFNVLDKSINQVEKFHNNIHRQFINDKINNDYIWKQEREE
ncbi:exosome 3-_5 exonuclease complex component, rRNA processing, putative [Candida dubliniensis CD36]|uniref:Exosome 3->5 exonuclease complex component, rRNA processing, putative n=1 Tax=Candida dubliniensis (strain CD36 / ATCC MYA-646 / CBS 7987 / NCPF 3949 / NRRL Y-17841) TaxID=573826 RepID=B9WBV5_CANDC|nr:exosome 3->5 exonuclease complex component, rRNA processing, putative [Candida dubliniensis CD36]CAX43877.1 exosome 3->5 exonuclease complex component, rRNA processing, putative [Candida dubliniensis CD36]